MSWIFFNICTLVISEVTYFSIKYSKYMKTAAKPHQQDFRVNLQSPSADLLHTFRVGADVLQKLLY